MNCQQTKEQRLLAKAERIAAQKAIREGLALKRAKVLGSDKIVVGQRNMVESPKKKEKNEWRTKELIYLCNKQRNGCSRDKTVKMFVSFFGQTHTNASIHRQFCQFQVLDKTYLGQQDLKVSAKARKIAISIDTNRYS